MITAPIYHHLTASYVLEREVMGTGLKADPDYPRAQWGPTPSGSKRIACLVLGNFKPSRNLLQSTVPGFFGCHFPEAFMWLPAAAFLSGPTFPKPSLSFL
jgi:hypothetical protein